MSDMTHDEIKLYLDTARATAQASAAELATSQAALRAELKAGMAAVSVDVAMLKGEFHATLSAHTKWIAAMAFAVVAAGAAVSGIFRALPPTAPPFPYVVYSQTAQPPPQPAPAPATAPAASPAR